MMPYTYPSDHTPTTKGETMGYTGTDRRQATATGERTYYRNNREIEAWTETFELAGIDELLTELPDIGSFAGNLTEWEPGDPLKIILEVEDHMVGGGMTLTVTATLNHRGEPVDVNTRWSDT